MTDYLEQVEGDLKAARTLYQKLLDQPADAGIKAQAARGAARCRDGLAAADFATLMPADAIGIHAAARPVESRRS